MANGITAVNGNQYFFNANRDIQHNIQFTVKELEFKMPIGAWV